MRKSLQKVKSCMGNDSANFGDWLLKAANDLKAAKGILGYYEDPPTDTICYHCHQTAGKMLKGFLVRKGIKFGKMHDLIALLNLCLLSEQSLGNLRSELESLNKYYIETRYPPDMPIIYPKQEAEEAVNKAEFVFEAIKDRIAV